MCDQFPKFCLIVSISGLSECVTCCGITSIFSTLSLHFIFEALHLTIGAFCLVPGSTNYCSVVPSDIGVVFLNYILFSAIGPPLTIVNDAFRMNVPLYNWEHI